MARVERQRISMFAATNQASRFDRVRVSNVSLTMQKHAIRCKITGQAIAYRLDGGECRCDEDDCLLEVKNTEAELRGDKTQKQ